MNNDIFDQFQTQAFLQVVAQKEKNYKTLVKNCSKIQTGDLIFTRDNGLFARAIRFGTKGDVNHVGIVFKIEGMKKEEHVWVAEATNGGFLFRPYNYYYIQSSCAIGRVFDELTAEQRDDLRNELLKLIGTPYDWKAIVEIIKYIIVNGRGMPKNDLTEEANKVICSEGVPLIYWRTFQCKLVPSKPFRLTTPQDLYVAPKVNIYKTLDGVWTI